MSRSARLVLFFWLCVVAAGCDSAGSSTAAYPAPALLQPARAEAFAPGEVLIDWRLPDGATGSDYAEVLLDGHFEPARDQIRFDTLRAFSGGTDAGDGRQTAGLRFAEDSGTDLYLAYRVRGVGPAGEGAWSAVHSVRIRSLSTLRAVRLEVPVAFAFTPASIGGYYSGSETSAPVDLAALVRAMGLDPARVRALKPVGGRVLYTGLAGGDRDFTRVTVGFVDRADGGPDDLTDPLGDVYGVGPDATLTLYPYGGRYRDVASLLSQPRRLQMLYALRADAPTGEPRALRVELAMDAYTD